ncbi:hypothetical protein [Nostoc edaphicum]|nr:hypothetical protein [Nostoc edaphicum]
MSMATRSDSGFTSNGGSSINKLTPMSSAKPLRKIYMYQDFREMV